VFRFIINSFVFKKAIIITAFFIALFISANYIFDYLWYSDSFVILNRLDLVYKPPLEYDNITKINLKLENFNKVSIEGNKKFKLVGSSKNYDYYDTVYLNFPEHQVELLNKFFLKFDYSQYNDSIYIVVSKSNEENVYWKQIFLSSVFIDKLNEFDNSPYFKIENKHFLNEAMLDNNDSLIQLAYNYFNENKNNLKLGNCGMNCSAFKIICEKFNVPCRILILQGGDALNAGLNVSLGYPFHVICEVYSSRIKKWFVVDPSYGVTYSDEKELQNAVEISNAVFFNKMNRITQDSVLTTKTANLDRDYFKYYENVYYNTNYEPGLIIRNVIRYFYKKFEPRLYQYSSNISKTKDGYYYAGVKSVVFLIILISHFNIILFIVVKRLVMAKREPGIKKNDRKYFSTG